MAASKPTSWLSSLVPRFELPASEKVCARSQTDSETERTPIRVRPQPNSYLSRLIDPIRSMLSENAGAAPTMFPLALPPPPSVFQPLPHRGVPFFAHPAPLPPPHATIPYPSNDGVVHHHHHHAVPPPPVLGLQIIPITAANYAAELDTIGSLLTRYPFVTIDTEYPGSIHRPPSYHKLTPPERYKLLPIVQLGITLCDEYGNLPTVVASDGYPLFELAWEVTFSDFDPHRDRHAPSPSRS
ncbi:hypothetical protein HU200_049686 [Digitaria exilis]|uniref:Uncharacterized protein n=1 Tax=Digitaria exilis TaxID=1010633 RepID=A0A835AQS8_9POAL|nr:hypothetical protein HU200_049686 [Digitaria exilis]